MRITTTKDNKQIYIDTLERTDQTEMIKQFLRVMTGKELAFKKVTKFLDSNKIQYGVVESLM